MVPGMAGRESGRQGLGMGAAAGLRRDEGYVHPHGEGGQWCLFPGRSKRESAPAVIMMDMLIFSLAAGRVMAAHADLLTLWIALEAGKGNRSLIGEACSPDVDRRVAEPHPLATIREDGCGHGSRGDGPATLARSGLAQPAKSAGGSEGTSVREDDRGLLVSFAASIRLGINEEKTAHVSEDLTQSPDGAAHGPSYFADRLRIRELVRSALDLVLSEDVRDKRLRRLASALYDHGELLSAVAEGCGAGTTAIGSDEHLLGRWHVCESDEALSRLDGWPTLCGLWLRVRDAALSLLDHVATENVKSLVFASVELFTCFSKVKNEIMADMIKGDCINKNRTNE